MRLDPGRFLGLDSRFLDPAGIDDDARAFNVDVERRLDAAPPRWEMSVESERALAYGGGALPGNTSVNNALERTIPGADGNLTLRIIEPESSPLGIYLHAHGGGWAAGAASRQDESLLQIALGAGVVAVSVDYRLAPEHPYPAAVDDLEAATVWLAANMQQEFGCDRIVVGGESAGAHLATLTILRMRDRRAFTGFAAANLSMGMYDLRLTGGARAWGRRRLMLDTPTLRFQVQRFLAGADPDDPGVSPLLAEDLSGLPPALFTVGTEDPLLEDTIFMYVRWKLAQNQAKLLTYPGGMHGFPITPTRIGRECSEAIVAFVANAVTR